MKIKRILSILLLSAILISSMSCGNTKQPDDTVGGASDKVDDTEPVETEVSDDLPADLKFSGRELRILSTNNTNQANLLVDEATGDVCNDAIYKRNEKIKERFDITMTEISADWYEARDTARTAIMANEDVYDIISVIDREALTFASEGMIYPAEDVENIDLTKPYWNQLLNENMTIGGRKILAYSDMALTTYDFTHILTFNKNMIEELQLESPYDLVESGKWTLDKYAQYVEQATTDLNGDTKFDKEDRYGFVSYAKHIAPCLWISTGCLSIEKNDDDIPVFNMNNEKMLSVIEKAYELSWGNDYWYKTAWDDWFSSLELFTSGHALFNDTTFGDLFGDYYRDMKSDYGVIPFPKYDEQQDTYYSRVEGGCPYFIPVTVNDTSFAGAMMEAMACESYKSVIPAYYEVALKAKFTRDDQSGAIIDMMMQNRVYDWGDTFFCDAVRDGFMASAFINGTPVAASDIEANRPKVELAIQKIVDAFEE
ncbi:MAG: hypothetical protein HFE63_02015 [Clostridiales bacterium]|nr:hypothetical protein [Clostridiales bacterium]